MIVSFFFVYMFDLLALERDKWSRERCSPNCTLEPSWTNQLLLIIRDRVVDTWRRYTEHGPLSITQRTIIDGYWTEHQCICISQAIVRQTLCFASMDNCGNECQTGNAIILEYAWMCVACQLACSYVSFTSILHVLCSPNKYNTLFSWIRLIAHSYLGFWILHLFDFVLSTFWPSPPVRSSTSM